MALRNSIMSGVMFSGEEVTAHRLSAAPCWLPVEAKSFSGLSPLLGEVDLEQLAVVGEFLADVIDKVGEAGIGQVHHVLRSGFPVRRDQSVFRIEGVNGEFRQDGPVSGGAQAVNVDVNGWSRSVDADGAVFRLQGGPGVVRAIGQRFRIDGEVQEAPEARVAATPPLLPVNTS